MELIKKSLCESYIDYQPLLANLSYIKTILISAGNCGLYELDAALLILKNLFYDPGEWYNQTVNPPISCFKELPLYYNSKCTCKMVYWMPNINHCVQAAADLANGGPYMITSFVELANLFAKFLGMVAINPQPYSIKDVLDVINAFCDILKQRIIIDSILMKSLLTISNIQC
ncbi:hypothetical protein QKU48_gp1183 [Fadolivirus algeromassiliense]|jgi:hypothetical protein|uniref:Uncharacterized protein n=1 Tax=Fadolivirus FV1/VV64 TaxID=3070911 RepID=A0A7D3R1W8_9VIRU|nr:hypothetical protein QKU48_gp1183 [Fadolivirus algeromassiliense]QKF94641.1 hypothetical protein Fadolivirus_1_1183 [Fadolivirus FV1/VV64]